MALIKCPECNKEISNEAELCIYCGFSIKSYIDKCKNEEFEKEIANKSPELKKHQKEQLNEIINTEIQKVIDERTPDKPDLTKMIKEENSNLIFVAAFGLVILIIALITQTYLLVLFSLFFLLGSAGGYIKIKEEYNHKLDEFNLKGNAEEYKNNKLNDIKSSYLKHPILTNEFDNEYTYICPICGKNLDTNNESIPNYCNFCDIHIQAPYISLHQNTYYKTQAIIKKLPDSLKLIVEEAKSNPLFDNNKYEKQLDVNLTIHPTNIEIPQSQTSVGAKLKCPICNSTNILRISTLNRTVSVATVGLASAKIGKQYECKSCKHKW